MATSMLSFFCVCCSGAVSQECFIAPRGRCYEHATFGSESAACVRG